MNACPYIFSYIKVKIQLSSLKLYVIFFFYFQQIYEKVCLQPSVERIIKIISQYIYWILACQALYKAHVLFRKIFTKTLWHR